MDIYANRNIKDLIFFRVFFFFHIDGIADSRDDAGSADADLWKEEDSRDACCCSRVREGEGIFATSSGPAVVAAVFSVSSSLA